MKRMIKASRVSSADLISQLPDYLIPGLKKLSYPIGVEQCGFTSTLEQAKEFVKDRTARNPKSHWHDMKSAEHLIDDLFDSAADLGISVQQLVSMARFMRSKHCPYALLVRDYHEGGTFEDRCRSAYSKKYCN